MSNLESKRKELRKKQGHDRGEVKTAHAQIKHLIAQIKRKKKRIQKRQERIKKISKRIRKHKRHQDSTTVMYDSVTVSEIPRDPDAAAAGYVNGLYNTWSQIQAGPWKHKLPIAVSVSADAECLDVEAGDATNDQAPDWVKRQHGRGIHKPVVYTSVSNASALLSTLARSGIQRDEVRLWTAHYTFHPHLCSPACGYGLTTTADATQWTDHSGGRNLDESLVGKSFF